MDTLFEASRTDCRLFFSHSFQVGSEHLAAEGEGRFGREVQLVGGCPEKTFVNEPGPGPVEDGGNVRGRVVNCVT